MEVCLRGKCNCSREQGTRSSRRTSLLALQYRSVVISHISLTTPGKILAETSLIVHLLQETGCIVPCIGIFTEEMSLYACLNIPPEQECWKYVGNLIQLISIDDVRAYVTNWLVMHPRPQTGCSIIKENACLVLVKGC